MPTAVAVPAALSGLGLLAQNEANRKQQNAANDQNRIAAAAQASQDRLIQRQLDLSDLVLGQVRQADGAGMWDAGRQVARLDADVAANRGRDLAGAAGALRIAGYRPGDSAVTDGIAGVDLGWREKRAGLADEIRRGTAMQRLQAYAGAANPGAMSQGIAAYGQRSGEASQRAAYELSRQQPLGPAVAGLAAYLPAAPAPAGGRPYGASDFRQGASRFRWPTWR